MEECANCQRLEAACAEAQAKIQEILKIGQGNRERRERHILALEAALRQMETIARASNSDYLGRQWVLTTCQQALAGPEGEKAHGI